MLKTFAFASALVLVPAVLAGQSTGAGGSGSTQSAGSAQGHGSTPGAAAQTSGAQSADARIRATLAAAAAAHIPTQLLESKVAEGRAKHVPEERIATAVDQRFQALRRAASALQGAGVKDVSPGQLAVSADALQAGVTQNALVKLQGVAPADEREVATATLAQLVQLGYGSDAALQRVTGAIAQGAEALANLRAEAAASLRVRGGIDIHVP